MEEVHKSCEFHQEHCNSDTVSVIVLTLLDSLCVFLNNLDLANSIETGYGMIW